MNVDQLVKLLDAVTGFIEVLVWPFLAMFTVLMFKSAIRTFLESLGEISLKGGGLEASAKRTQIEAAANLAAAAATDSREKTSPSEAARTAADVVSEVLTNKAVRRARRSRILWVDDNPDNNRTERESFESLGIGVFLAKSTDEALQALKEGRFDLVISDMGRPPDDRAGYTLLRSMQEQGIRVPFLIYTAGGNLPAHQMEALSRGAIGSTSRATELFQRALRALGAT